MYLCPYLLLCSCCCYSILQMLLMTFLLLLCCFNYLCHKIISIFCRCFMCIICHKAACLMIPLFCTCGIPVKMQNILLVLNSSIKLPTSILSEFFFPVFYGIFLSRFFIFPIFGFLMYHTLFSLFISLICIFVISSQFDICVDYLFQCDVYPFS